MKILFFLLFNEHAISICRTKAYRLVFTCHLEPTTATVWRPRPLLVKQLKHWMKSLWPSKWIEFPTWFCNSIKRHFKWNTYWYFQIWPTVNQPNPMETMMWCTLGEPHHDSVHVRDITTQNLDSEYKATPRLKSFHTTPPLSSKRLTPQNPFPHYQ